MLRLVDPKKYRSIKILDTTFQLRCMSVREKFALVDSLQTMQPDLESFDTMINSLCEVISTIEGYDNVKETLSSVEDFDDLQTIIREIIKYCSMQEEASKNLDSSLDGYTPDPVGK